MSALQRALVVILQNDNEGALERSALFELCQHSNAPSLSFYK